MTVAGLLARANEALAQSDLAWLQGDLDANLRFMHRTTAEDWRLAQALLDRLA